MRHFFDLLLLAVASECQVTACLVCVCAKHAFTCNASLLGPLGRRRPRLPSRGRDVVLAAASRPYRLTSTFVPRSWRGDAILHKLIFIVAHRRSTVVVVAGRVEKCHFLPVLHDESPGTSGSAVLYRSREMCTMSWDMFVLSSVLCAGHLL